MTAKTGMEKEQKQTQHKELLKGALAEVLQKDQQATVPAEVQKPEFAEVKPPQKTGEKKPFEVPEDALRKVLKGES